MCKPKSFSYAKTRKEKQNHKNGGLSTGKNIRTIFGRFLFFLLFFFMIKFPTILISAGYGTKQKRLKS